MSTFSIYLHLDCKNNIFYVGKASNWDRRECDHHKRNKGKIRKYGCDRCPIMMVPLGFFYGTDGVAYCNMLEKVLIRTYAPIFNDQHNPGSQSKRNEKQNDWRKKNCKC